jgi:hypothetical protein
VVDFALPTLIFLGCARELTVRETAELSLFLAASAIMNVVLSFGQDAWILRFGSDLPTDDLNPRFIRRLAISAIGSVAVCGLLVVLSIAEWLPVQLSPTVLLLGASFVVSLSAVGFATQLLLARMQSKSTILPAIGVRVVQVVMLLIVFYTQESTYIWVILSYVVATGIQAVVLSRSDRLNVFGQEWAIGRSPSAGYAKDMWVADLANLLLGRQVDVVLLLILVGSAASIATYNLGSQMISSIEAGLSFGILSTFLPHFKEFRSDKDLRKEHRTALSFYSKWASPIIGLSIVLSSPVVRGMYGNKYTQLETILTLGLGLLLFRIGVFGGNLGHQLAFA